MLLAARLVLKCRTRRLTTNLTVRCRGEGATPNSSQGRGGSLPAVRLQQLFLDQGSAVDIKHGMRVACTSSHRASCQVLN